MVPEAPCYKCNGAKLSEGIFIDPFTLVAIPITIGIELGR